MARAWFEQQSVFGEAQLIIAVFEPSPLIATMARPQLTSLDPTTEERLTLESLLWPLALESANLAVLDKFDLLIGAVSEGLITRSPGDPGREYHCVVAVSPSFWS